MQFFHSLPAPALPLRLGQANPDKVLGTLLTAPTRGIVPTRERAGPVFPPPPQCGGGGNTGPARSRASGQPVEDYLINGT